MATHSGLCPHCRQPFESELRDRLTRALGAVEVNSAFAKAPRRPLVRGESLVYEEY